MHFEAFLYVLYTILGFLDIDSIIIGYFAHMAVLPWIVLYILSKRFMFCYVHRLPLYYIAANELITTGDYYLNIPEDYFTPLVLHSIIFGLLILGYSIYYVKYKLRNEKRNKILQT